MVKRRFKVLQESPCDLLLTDLEMPNLDGLSLVAAVRDLPMHRFLPVLVLSCRQPSEFQPEHRQGVTGWLVKPIEPEQLEAVGPAGFAAMSGDSRVRTMASGRNRSVRRSEVDEYDQRRGHGLSGSADDRFREMFYEEARELLISLEEGLMDLERRQSDRAHLDKTFRAAHSLKGAAAMVGLASIAEFTHGIEAVLDRIRAGLLAVDSDIITTLLEARDHLAAMVEAEAARSPIPAVGRADPAAGCRCCAGQRQAKRRQASAAASRPAVAASHRRHRAELPSSPPPASPPPAARRPPKPKSKGR